MMIIKIVIIVITITIIIIIVMPWGALWVLHYISVTIRPPPR